MNPASNLATRSSDVPAPAFAARRLGWTSDDDSAACGWRHAMQAEHLAFVDALPWADPSQPAPDALVLYLSNGLTDQLGRLREIRSLHPDLPMLVVGRALRDLDQVLALEMGADDVVDAQLGAPVVAARLRALWRRMSTTRHALPPAPTQLAFGALHLMRAQRRVSMGGCRIALTEGEFELLWLLALKAGQTVSRVDLLQQLRGLRDAGPDRSIDCRIYRIRAKLGDAPGQRQRIRTIRNFGYLFSPEAC